MKGGGLSFRVRGITEWERRAAPCVTNQRGRGEGAHIVQGVLVIGQARLAEPRLAHLPKSKSKIGTMANKSWLIENLKPKL